MEKDREREKEATPEAEGERGREKRVIGREIGM